MPLFYNYGGSDLGTATVRLGSVSGLQEVAENGNYGSSGIEIDDPAGALSLTGWKTFTVNESLATPQRIFTGYAAMRRISRGRSSFRTGGARLWSVDLIDLNAVLSLRVLRGSTAIRPAGETETARLAWLLGYMAPHLYNNGLANPGSLGLDAVDYTGRYPIDVLTDMIAMTTRTFFVYNDSTTGQPSLYYNDLASASFSSSARFTNVLADVDNSTTWAATAEMTRDPSQVYSRVYVPFGGGGTATVENATTATNFIERDVVMPAPQLGKLTSATAYANAILSIDAGEEDRITVVARKIPAANVNDVLCGQRVQIKFTHLPGYSGSYSYLRCVRRTVAQDEETSAFYTVTLELNLPRIQGAGLSGLPANTTVWPSQQPPFVPSAATGYVGVVAADGAIHAWKYNEASGDVLDYIDSVNGTVVTAGTNPQRLTAGPASITGAKEFGQTAAGGADHVYAQNDGADFPAGNSDWTVEWWHSWNTVFFATEDVMAWGSFHTNKLTAISTFGGGINGPSVVIITSGITWSNPYAAGAGVVPMPATATNGVNHNYMVTYTGSTRTATMYYDGVAQGSVVASADLTLDPPSGSGLTTMMQFFGGEGFDFGWQSIYPTALTAAQAANHALGDAASTSSTAPATGQPIAAESATSDGTTVLYTTNYPYSPGSLDVHVNGVKVIVTETSPTAGTFTLPSAPPAGSLITWTYNAASPTSTGVANPPPAAGVGGVPQTITQLVNKSGGSVAAGDVVIVDTTNNSAFTTTTTAQVTKVVGIAQATIASNATGPVLLEGYAGLVNTTASVTRGNYAETSTTVKKATENATRRSGSFAQYITGGTTPTAILFGVPDSSGGGGASPLTTKGDVWGYSTVDARIPIGANATVLTADSTQALGLKWASGAVSPLTTKGDIWGFSTVDARLPVGSNTQVLTADSTQTLGIKWAAAGGSSGFSLPTVVQSATTTNGVAVTLGGTPTNGNRLVLMTAGSNSGTTAVSSTNTTWTRMGSGFTDGGGYHLDCWVGVAAASAGTVITCTNTSTFTQVTVCEVADALTPTSTTLQGSTTAGGTIGSGVNNTTPLVPAAGGHFIAILNSNDNAGNQPSGFVNIPVTFVTHQTGMDFYIGYTPSGGGVFMNVVAVGGCLMVEIT